MQETPHPGGPPAETPPPSPPTQPSQPAQPTRAPAEAPNIPGDVDVPAPGPITPTG